MVLSVGLMMTWPGPGNIAHLMTPSPPIPIRALSLCIPGVLFYWKAPCKNWLHYQQPKQNILHYPHHSAKWLQSSTSQKNSKDKALAFTLGLPISSAKLLNTTKALFRSQQITRLILEQNIYQCACIISVTILYEKHFHRTCLNHWNSCGHPHKNTPNSPVKTLRDLIMGCTTSWIHYPRWSRGSDRIYDQTGVMYSTTFSLVQNRKNLFTVYYLLN